MGNPKVEITVGGVRLEVSRELEAAVLRACQGQLQTLPQEMTTTEAAEFLDVSRPYVVKLVKQGELPCRMVGNRHRIPTASLLEYREKMYRRAKAAADALVAANQQLGLYDNEAPAPE